MIAPIPIIVVAAAAARGRADEASETSGEPPRRSRRRDPETVETALRLMEAEELAERTAWRWTIAMLACGAAAAAFMLWAWLRDTGRI